MKEGKQEMKAEYVNQFLTECQRIFNDAAGIDLMYKGTSVKKSPVSTKSVVVIIGVTGDLRGSIAINMDEDFAKKIASNMMGGMAVPEFSELSKSAIAELGNMIMGRVSTAFSTKGITIDITPPSLMTGHGIVLSVVNMPLLSIKFAYEMYEMDFDISISER
jgi:chemotaxis protein CheX